MPRVCSTNCKHINSDYMCEKCTYTEKPPIGVMPKHIWDAKRKQDLLEAVMRYMDKNKPVPVEWIQEFNELVSK